MNPSDQEAVNRAEHISIIFVLNLLAHERKGTIDTCKVVESKIHVKTRYKTKLHLY